MRRRSPQEKKALSYVKDCRSNYGANDEASRKNLPRKRARVHRANRHRAHQVLLEATGSFDEVRCEAVEDQLRGRRPKVFNKWPDLPLGVWARSRRERA